MSESSEPAIELIDVSKDYGTGSAPRRTSTSTSPRESSSSCSGRRDAARDAPANDRRPRGSPERRDLHRRAAVQLHQPGDRDVAMVFQNYALYPHMTVRKNLAFPLQDARGQPKDEWSSAVEGRRTARSSTTSSTATRTQLSGGQRQRVALGRAIVREPRGVPDGRAALEPRRQLRVQMRTELMRLHRRVGVDDDLRHPRPGRGDDHGRPDRDHARRRGAAGRHARRCLRLARPTFVATFVGQPADEHLRGDAGDRERRAPLRRTLQPAARGRVGGRARRTRHDRRPPRGDHPGRG